MMKLPFLLFLTASAALSAGAVSLSPEEALLRLSNSDAPALARRAAKAETLELAFTKMATGIEKPAFYAFNRPAGGGFILLSADDRFPAVIGYSENGTFDETLSLPNVSNWFESYARQIGFALLSGEPEEDVESLRMEAKANRAPAIRHSVEPLVKTLWDQTAPYFNDCPPKNGSHYYTGCVATAMAQVLKTLEWPEDHAFGSNSYSWNNQTLSFDFESTSFDWDNMLNEYTAGNYTAEQGAAVALLMKACGASVNMQYMETQSGAFAPAIQGALINYFGYDKGVSYEIRDFYTSERWNELIYNELANGRPVIYDGTSSAGGHCFICDGYSEDDYFHINWGWSGTSNGYFLLSMLTPETVGSGATLGNFNMDQDAIIGIQTPKEGSSFKAPVYGYGNNLGAISPVTANSGTVTFKFGPSGMNTGYVNFSSLTYKAQMGAAVYKEGQLYKYISGPEANFLGLASDGSLAVLNAYNLSIRKNDLPAGEYILAPAIKPAGGDWQRIRFHYNAPQYTNLDFDGSTFTFNNVTSYNMPNIKVETFETEADLLPDTEIPVSFDVRNFATKGSAVTIWVICTNKRTDEVAAAVKVAASLRRNDVTTLTATLPGLPAGEYSVIFNDEMADTVSMPFDMIVGQSGVASIADTENLPMEVFTLQGIRVMNNASAADLNSLPAGTYIVTDGINPAKKIIK